MLRSLYIVAIVMSLVSGLLIPFQHDRIVTAYIRVNHDTYNPVTDKFEERTPDPAEIASFENQKLLFSVMAAFSILFFMVLFVLTLMRLRTTTMLVLSVIGLLFSLVGACIAVIGMLQDRLGSFEMVAIYMMGLGAITLAFSIVGVVHAFRKKC